MTKDNKKECDVEIKVFKQRVDRVFTCKLLENITDIEDDLISKVFTIIGYLLLLMIVFVKILSE